MQITRFLPPPLTLKINHSPPKRPQSQPTTPEIVTRMTVAGLERVKGYPSTPRTRSSGRKGPWGRFLNYLRD